MKGKLAVFLTLSSFTNLILGITSVSTPVWVQTSNTSFGLWERCTENICDDELGSSNIRATQAFFLLGLILILPCIGLSAYKATDITNDKRTSYLQFISFLLTVIFFVIAMSVFSGTVQLSANANYGYSFVLGWIVFAFSCLDCVIAGFLLRLT